MIRGRRAAVPSARPAMRVAPKNHRRSFCSGPPKVASYIGTVVGLRGARRRRFGSLAAGVNERQLSLANDVRNEPLNVLPPDLVTALDHAAGKSAVLGRHAGGRDGHFLKRVLDVERIRGSPAGSR